MNEQEAVPQPPASAPETDAERPPAPAAGSGGGSQPTTGTMMKTPMAVMAQQSAWDRLKLLTRLAGLGYILLTIVARLPVAMLPLSTLVLVVTRTGDLLLGGYTAGAVALSVALAVPAYGFLAQRVGRRPVLVFCSVANLVAVYWLLEQASSLPARQGPMPLLFLACVLAGASAAPVGALARVRWAAESQRLADRAFLRSTWAFESVADVLAIVLGAAVTGLSGVLWSEATAFYLIMAVSLFGVMGLSLIRQRPVLATEPEPAASADPTERPRQRMLWLPVLGTGALGLLLGSMQSSLVSFTLNFDTVATVGLLYAILGGSALASAALINLVSLSTHTWGAWLAWASVLTLVGLPASMASTVGTMALTLVAEGAAVGVALIVTDSVAAAVTPSRLLEVVLTSGFAALLSGTGLGLVWGAVLGESLGYSSALLLPLLAAFAYFVLAHLYGWQWRKHFEDPSVR